MLARSTLMFRLVTWEHFRCWSISLQPLKWKHSEELLQGPWPKESHLLRWRLWLNWCAQSDSWQNHRCIYHLSGVLWSSQSLKPSGEIWGSVFCLQFSELDCWGRESGNRNLPASNWAQEELGPKKELVFVCILFYWCKQRNLLAISSLVEVYRTFQCWQQSMICYIFRRR